MKLFPFDHLHCSRAVFTYKAKGNWYITTKQKDKYMSI